MSSGAIAFIIYLVSVLIAWLCIRKALLLDIDSLHEFRFPAIVIFIPIMGLIMAIVILVTTILDKVSNEELLRKVYLLPKKPDQKS